ncbi:tRNA pseudouridine(38-40) synthase TruA [Emcibacter sp. SYSU 3D8]|uniref:tRNA pseudouridine(38-40) synthase TruA n=1 Tax=Emcibacter sp. SYSU 3D8 TaxID=3133969 RepID=UPI0031FEFA1C
MPRYRLTIEYDGGPFVGFQRQTNGPSIQAALERAIERFSGEAVTIIGAGRTDAGVHAEGQVVHFDLLADKGPNEVQGALNHHLKPDPVAVLDAAVAAPDFHARFDAVGRAYRYRIVNRRPPLTLDRGLAWQVPVPLDAGAMHAAAQHLVGRHDFTTFRSAHCQAQSPLKTLDRLDVSRHGAELTVIAEARSFLHHQVRSMVGTLKLVGEGKWTPDDVAAALEARDRQRLGLNAPPDGLYLTRVVYPAK